MSQLLRILLLVPVLAGMLLVDAQMTVGCGQAVDGDSQSETNSSCCQTKVAPVAEESCCATKGAGSRPSTSQLDCCCKGSNKPSCGCQCRRPNQERVPPSPGPQQAQSSMAKLAATGAKLIVCDEHPEFGNEFSSWLKSSSIGSALSVLYCRWRH